MIEKALLISTANLAESTAIDINHGETFGIRDLFNGEYGYIVNPAAVVAAIGDGCSVPLDLANVAQYALSEGCILIYFDCDVEPEPDVNGLQVFDW